MWNKYINLAQKIASNTEYRKGRQRCCAIALDRKGNILSIGLNSYDKTHPLQAKAAKAVGRAEAIFLHSELDAIRKTDKKIDTMIVVRLGSSGQLLPSCPCKICRHAIKEAEIKTVIYQTGE